MSSRVNKKGFTKKIKLHELNAYSYVGENKEGEDLMDCHGEHVTMEVERESDLEQNGIEEKDDDDNDDDDDDDSDNNDDVSLKDKHFCNTIKNKGNKINKKNFRKQMNEMMNTPNFSNESISKEGENNTGSGNEEECERNDVKNDGTFSEYDLRYIKEGRIQKGYLLDESQTICECRTCSDLSEKEIYKRRRKGRKAYSVDKKNCKIKISKGVSKQLHRLLLHANINNKKQKVYNKDTMNLGRSDDFHLVGAVTEYTNIREENIESGENCIKKKESDIVVNGKVGEHFDTAQLECMDNTHTNYDVHVYNSECVNKLYNVATYSKQFPNEITYNDTNYEDTNYKKENYKKGNYNCKNKNTVKNEPGENVFDTTEIFYPKKEDIINKHIPLEMKNKIVTDKDSCNQWNITNTKENDDMASYCSQKTYNLNESDVNEDLQENAFALNNVNINDLYNSGTETKAGEMDLANTKNSSDLLINAYDKKRNIDFLYNFLKKSKMGKKKKKKMELREVNNGHKQRHCFYNDKEKMKQAQSKGGLHTDRCISFGNTEVAEEPQQLHKNQKIKYKRIENKKTADSKNIHEEEANKKKKKLKGTNKRKTKISARLLKDMQEHEAIKKWKQKLRLIQKVASNDKKKTKIHVLVFVVFLCLNIFINYDSGILPVSLNQITKDFHLSITLQGLIGAMPYIGLTLASFFLGTLLQKYEQKKIIANSMILNIINISASFFCTNKYLFLFLRLLYGITHSVLIIYIPVWADEYAPSLNLTFWLGLIHISTIIGITIGYLCTGLLIFFEYSWMYSLLIQACFLSLFSLLLFGIPKRFINISDISKNQNLSNISKYTIFDTDTTDGINDIEEEDPTLGVELGDSKGSHGSSDIFTLSTAATVTPITDGSEAATDIYDNNTIIIYISHSTNKIENLDDFNDIADKQTTQIVGELRMEPNILYNKKMGVFQNVIYKAKKTYFISSIASILRCPLYMWLVCSLCNLFFVVIGIFFWSTKFFTNYLNIGSLEAMFYFIGTSLTAPVIGILLGSKIVDKFIGGYKEYRSRLKTLYFCIFNSFLTSLMALMICIFDNYKFTLIFTWAILLFGAMLLPPITGIILSTVKSERRSFASACSMFMYNIFGYALGTFFPGFIVDFFNVSEVISIKVVYLWTFLGLFNLCVATFFAKRKKSF